MKHFVGCSGYFYYHWKGIFYPPDLKPNEWFDYYIKFFNSLELNSSFYRIPKKTSIKRYFTKTPENYKVSIKVNKVITHLKKFKDTEKLIKDFYNNFEDVLKEKIGVYLFQLPPSLKFSLNLLEDIVAQIDTKYKNALEFRDKSWWDDKTYEILSKNKIGFCSISAPKLPEELIKTADFVYIRFHGKIWYRYNYSKEELYLWIDKISKTDAKECYVYFNNDFEGFAPKNALEFKELLEKR